jgi:polyketide-type polyunsaturated fatty acid synthase PfaA
LAELRTLQQIVDYIQEQVPTGSVAASSVAASPATNATAFDVEALTQEMLTVVAEKTGYPSEMLELDMDMEADLGIDSIKRVEILGSIQEAHPELPELDPEVLAELRTLRQIVEYIERQVPSASVATQTSEENKVKASASVALDVEALTQEMLAVVADKTGYPSEMLELGMDMEADLGIDSIKRVEILGTVQEQNPELPELDPEALAELRTLGEIVNYMKEQAVGGAGEGQGSAELVSLDEYKQNQNKNEEQTASQLKPARAYVKVKSLPRPDTLVSEAPKDKSCLIVNDGTDLTLRLAEKYQSAGWNVAVLGLKDMQISEALEKERALTFYALSSFDESELESVLEKIQSEQGRIANFVYLDSTYKGGSKQGLAFSEKGKQHLGALFLLAKHLKASLVDAQSENRNAFVAVTHLDGCLGYSSPKQKTKYDALSGGVFGLLKTLSQEWPEVFCRAVDLDSSLKGEKAAELVFEENFDANSTLVEIGISKGGRCTLEADEKFEKPEAGEADDHQITKESVFVVSGGAKGVTSKCVIALAKAHKCGFVLLGRSELNDSEPAWAESCQDEASLKTAAMAELKAKGEKPTPVLVQKFINPVLSQREIKSVIGEIEKTGGRASYLACDVCDKKALAKGLKAAEKELGEISGLVHGAGVLADKLIENKTIEDFNAVFDTKIGGLASLLAFVDLKNLKHLVLFSSAAGFFGNPAQSDYAMANDILNKVAMIIQSHHKDCRVLSFNWGPWDGGMVTPQLKKLFESRGVELISLEGGAELFVDYLSAQKGKHAQVLVGSSMEAAASEDFSQKKSLKFEKKILLRRVMNSVDNPFLEAHKIAGQAVLPIVCSAAWHASGAKSCFPDLNFSSLKNVQVFKGLTFDDAKDQAFFQEISFSKEEDGAIELVSRIFSENEGKPCNHYGASVVLSANKAAAQSNSSLLIENDEEIGDAEVFYEDGTLFHGKGFRLLDDLIKDDESFMVFDSEVAEFSAKEQGQFPETEFNHFSMDALLQACLVWAKSHKGLPSLPLKVGEFNYFRALEEEEFFISLKVNDQSTSKMVCDLFCHNKKGELYAEMRGAEITMSKQLETKFAS